VADGGDPRDPEDPLGSAVAERYEDPGEEEQREDRMLTIGAAASAFGITAVIASPSAQNAAEPTRSITRKRSSVLPVGTCAP